MPSASVQEAQASPEDASVVALFFAIPGGRGSPTVFATVAAKRPTICSTVRRWSPLVTRSSSLTEPPSTARSPEEVAVALVPVRPTSRPQRTRPFSRPDGAMERAIPFNTWVKWASTSALAFGSTCGSTSTFHVEASKSGTTTLHHLTVRRFRTEHPPQQLRVIFTALVKSQFNTSILKLLSVVVAHQLGTSVRGRVALRSPRLVPRHVRKSVLAKEANSPKMDLRTMSSCITFCGSEQSSRHALLEHLNWRNGHITQTFHVAVESTLLRNELQGFAPLCHSTLPLTRGAHATSTTSFRS